MLASLHDCRVPQRIHAAHSGLKIPRRNCIYHSRHGPDGNDVTISHWRWQNRPNWMSGTPPPMRVAMARGAMPMAGSIGRWTGRADAVVGAATASEPPATSSETSGGEGGSPTSSSSPTHDGPDCAECVQILCASYCAHVELTAKVPAGLYHSTGSI